MSRGLVPRRRMRWSLPGVALHWLVAIVATGVVGLADAAAPRDAVLGIAPPFRLSRCDSYRDGGSIGGVLLGSASDSIGFCLPMQARAHRVGYPAPPSRPLLLCLGTSSPLDTVGHALPHGSSAESTLIAAVRSAVDSTIPPSDQDSLYSHYFDYGVTWEARQRFLPPLTVAFRSAMNALRIVHIMAYPAGSK